MSEHESSRSDYCNFFNVDDKCVHEHKCNRSEMYYFFTIDSRCVRPPPLSLHAGVDTP